MRTKTNDIANAKQLLEKEKTERATKAKEAFEKICKEFNVDFVPTAMINNQGIPVAQLLNLQIGISVMPK